MSNKTKKRDASSPKRSLKRRLLIRAGIAIAILVALIHVLFGVWSPIAQIICRSVVRKSSERVPELTVGIRRAGVTPALNGASILGLNVAASDFGSISIDKVTVRLQMAKLLTGRVVIHSIIAQDLCLRVDATQPTPSFLPVVTEGDMDSMAESRTFSMISVNDIPDVRLGGTLSFRLLLATNGVPTEIMLTNMVVVMEDSTNTSSALPMSFHGDGKLLIDNGSEATVKYYGGIDPRTDIDTMNMSLDLSILDIPLSDLNATVLQTAPLYFKEGTVSLHCSVRCRDGRLSGLASFNSKGMKITDNPRDRGGKFLGLTASLWEKLASRDGGIIIADCDIGGTLRDTIIPVRAALAEQALAVGEGAALKTMVLAPGLADISKAIQKHSVEKNRYDDILKISRLPREVRHYERGRHYENSVKNYEIAAKEYRAQVAEFPTKEEEAVDALFALSKLQYEELDREAQAIETLREVLTAYPRHVKADDALLKMITIAEDIKLYPQANTLCIEFLDKFPNSALKKKAISLHKKIRPLVW
jgi:TolA-binding protein